MGFNGQIQDLDRRLTYLEDQMPDNVRGDIEFLLKRVNDLERVLDEKPDKKPTVKPTQSSESNLKAQLAECEISKKLRGREMTRLRIERDEALDSANAWRKRCIKKAVKVKERGNVADENKSLKETLRLRETELTETHEYTADLETEIEGARKSIRVYLDEINRWKANYKDLEEENEGLQKKLQLETQARENLESTLEFLMKEFRKLGHEINNAVQKIYNKE